MKKSPIVLCIILVGLFLVAVQLLFSVPAPRPWLGAVWGAGDLITFVGTISLGVVAVYQTKKANDISFRLLQIEEARRRPQIDIRAICDAKLKQYDLNQLISASIEGYSVHVNTEWEEDVNEGDNFWFEMKNVKEADIIDILPIAVSVQILDPNKICMDSKHYTLSTSCNLNGIRSHDTVPFLLGMDRIWTKVALHPNQSLLLSLEFKLTNYDGEEYLQRISFETVNAYQNNSLTPVIYNKKVFPSERFS